MKYCAGIYLKWEKHGKEHGSEGLPSTVIQALRTATTLFPNTRILLKILCTLPVTTCSSERSRSGLKRIKVPYDDKRETHSFNITEYAS